MRRATKAAHATSGSPLRPTPSRRKASPAAPSGRRQTDRPPRALKDSEAPHLGGKRVRLLDTPPVPHNGDAGLIYEETTGTLFSSDLFTQVGPADPLTESDIVAPAIAVAERLPFMPPTPTPMAALKPTTIALMHGPTFKGDGAAALESLAEYYGK